MNRRKRRIIACLLALTLVLSSGGISALAKEDTGSTGGTVSEEPQEKTGSQTSGQDTSVEENDGGKRPESRREVRLRRRRTRHRGRLERRQTASLLKTYSKPACRLSDGTGSMRTGSFRTQRTYGDWEYLAPAKRIR